ncbi:uncharacterized protein BT62DRAFT_924803 [Guyanagaster necrorhizus]|uniref:Uncharacterized protein n=1 Tax=Guyanagaster necrorhizus TaxID=856835 RepID=A0A9P8AL14_9AGAR|nr:uncharacterized protein BT62DRAFT_924803 [Guyanagaster necrorhizus MCA 3950]KAG7439280.1 hypothetical protein BT62DRAFT_924803 [Guyanagaster necrorhizus MCA 3950]
MPALWNVKEWGEREDKEEIMAIIEREEREKQKEIDMQEREYCILQEHREEEELSEDEVELDIRRQKQMKESQSLWKETEGCYWRSPLCLPVGIEVDKGRRGAKKMLEYNVNETIIHIF